MAFLICHIDISVFGSVLNQTFPDMLVMRPCMGTAPLHGSTEPACYLAPAIQHPSLTNPWKLLSDAWMSRKSMEINRNVWKSSWFWVVWNTVSVFFCLEADTTEMSYPKMSSFSHGCRILETLQDPTSNVTLVLIDPWSWQRFRRGCDATQELRPIEAH